MRETATMMTRMQQQQQYDGGENDDANDSNKVNGREVKMMPNAVTKTMK